MGRVRVYTKLLIAQGQTQIINSSPPGHLEIVRFCHGQKNAVTKKQVHHQQKAWTNESRDVEGPFHRNWIL
jgi:hypothetical protein